MMNHQSDERMRDSIKIIHIITGLNVGGAELMLQRLLLADPETKDTAIIITLTGLGKIGTHLQSLGYRIHSFDFHKLWHIPINFLLLIKLINYYKPEVVQTWMYHADFIGGLAARLAGCRNVIWGIRTSGAINKKRTYLIMRLCGLLSHIIPRKIVCVANAAFIMTEKKWL
ncbi:hypothetical protein OQJ13_09785 [Legionella sp. PATHC035]|uniref:hypothetical protein n=1 Tax=Legionella sp. PATHC035 TaxID=2992040 RepID=UPI0022441C1C|nr:hypothetical protein [Legionella sp. PATHC035]MCW8409263.1 hypothetical protein [Legionella sp. PATHC035]